MTYDDFPNSRQVHGPICPLHGIDQQARIPDGVGLVLADARDLQAAFAALDAVLQCEPFADVSQPGTEGFVVYELVAAARERLGRALGIPT